MDWSKRQRHTHRSLGRSRAGGQAMSRAEEMDKLRFASRTERLGIGDTSSQGLIESDEQGGGPSIPALSWLAETIEEQASESTAITAQLKEVLNQCLLMAIADTEGVFEPPDLSGPASSPEELLRALGKIVSRHSDGKTNLSFSSSSRLLERERQNAFLSGVPDEDSDDECSDWKDGLSAETIASGTAELATSAVGALVKKRRQRFVPAVTTKPDGLRVETFEDGAEITKDAHGRVLSIHSAVGESLSLHYDGDGNLDSFHRSDSKGNDHSICKRDHHGVVVRDSGGRARAAGESMTVDPHGCLSIHNHDGQMLSVDLVRGLHIERRKLADSSGHLSTMTAVFTHDGFRMATHFHEVIVNDHSRQANFGGRKVSPLRFYGRDGSAVEFSNEDDLLDVCPSRVLPPASYPVEQLRRGKRQARTAWEAVQEYLELLL